MDKIITKGVKHRMIKAVWLDEFMFRTLLLSEAFAFSTLIRALCNGAYGRRGYLLLYNIFIAA